MFCTKKCLSGLWNCRGTSLLTRKLLTGTVPEHAVLFGRFDLMGHHAGGMARWSMHLTHASHTRPW